MKTKKEEKNAASKKIATKPEEAAVAIGVKADMPKAEEPANEVKADESASEVKAEAKSKAAAKPAAASKAAKSEKPAASSKKATSDEKSAKASKAADSQKASKTADSQKASKQSSQKIAKQYSEKIVLQISGNEMSMENIVDRVKDAYVTEGHSASKIKDIAVYIKPEENMIYYVIDGYASGISLN